MDAHALLRLILPSSGWYVALGRHPTRVDRSGQPLRRQKAAPSVEHLVDLLNSWDREGFDCYHACASFEQERVWNAQKQKWETRTHDNVALVASLWSDIDTRESHATARYADRAEAWHAVMAFCQVVGISPPLVVSSGGGLHCYWPLDHELPLDEWHALAAALKRAQEAHGLATDPSRTADASSVLRTPGTHHQKSGLVVEYGELIDYVDVNLFRQLEEKYAPDGRRHAAGPALQPQTLSGQRGSILGRLQGVDYCDPGAVARGCQQVAFLVEHPGSCQQPVHYAGAGVFAAMGEPGRKYFLDFQRAGYPGHSDDWAIDVLDRNAPYPRTCDGIAAVNQGGPGATGHPEGCKGCPHQGKITSPIWFSRQWPGGGPGAAGAQPAPETGTSQGQNGFHSAATFVPETPGQITLPQLPKDAQGKASWKWSGFRLIQTGETLQGAPADQIVADYPCVLDALCRGEIVKENVTYVFRQWVPQEGWYPIQISGAELFNGKGFSALQGRGAHIRDAKLFGQFVMDSARDFELGTRKPMMFEQFGWKQNDTAFLLGERFYVPADTGEVVVSTGVVSDDIKPACQWLGPAEHSSAREWMKATTALWAAHDYAAQFAIMSTFGSVLLRLLAPNEGGAVVHYVNPDSGVGKTVLLETCWSVWGLKSALCLQTYDTAVAKGLWLAKAGNLPVFIDEMARMFKKEQPELLADFVIMLSLGEDRKRGEQSGKGVRFAAGHWCLTLLACSNNSITDILEAHARGTDAPAQRLFEASWPSHEFVSATGDALRGELIEHAGAAGDAFLKHLLRPEILKFACEALEDANMRYARALRTQDRFRVHLLACALVAGMLLQQIGLTAADPIKTVQWAAEQINRGQTKKPPVGGPVAALETLSEYLAEHNRDVLQVKLPWSPGQNNIDIFHPPARLLMRYESGPNRLYVDQKHFKAWAIGQGASWRDVVDKLKKARIITNEKSMRLGAGTNLPSGPVNVLEIDMSNQFMSGWAPPVAVNDG